MHDLIQEMGHYIVREEHPNNPEKHSRVWKHAEVSNMCFGDATVENDKIEAIKVDYNTHWPRFIMFISKMKKLRWLRLNMVNVENAEAPNCLSNELRYIDWSHYPASPFPDSFQAMNLIFLRLSHSKQKVLWKGYKHLPQLKVLQLEHLERLVSTPDFNGLTCLQKLELRRCIELEEIHPSLGNHRSLKYIDISDCHKLRVFPTIVRMEKLESLHISSCHKSFEFPEIQANMECLVKLDLYFIRIDALLSSIGERCINLISLSLHNCFILNSIEVKFDGLKSLKDFRNCGFKRRERTPLPHWLAYHRLTRSLSKLDLSYCRFEDGEIQSDIGELSNLQDLNLSYNNFSTLHFSLSQLTRLKLLNLSGCKRLVKLPELPSSIAILIANGCDKLTTIGDFNKNCKWLCHISLYGSTVIDGNRLLQSILKGNAIKNQSMHLKIEGLEIPKQFTHGLYYGNKCMLPLPANWCSDFCGFLICAVLDDSVLTVDSPHITIKEATVDEMGGMFHDVVWRESFGGKLTWVWYVSFASLRLTEWWNPTRKNVSFCIGAPTRNCCRPPTPQLLGGRQQLLGGRQQQFLGGPPMQNETFLGAGFHHSVSLNEANETYYTHVSLSPKLSTKQKLPSGPPGNSACIGLGASLVPMNNGSGLTDRSADSSEFTDEYTPRFRIHNDSKSDLKISPDVYGY